MIGGGAIISTARTLLTVDSSELETGYATAKQKQAQAVGEMRTQLSKLEESQLKVQLAQEKHTKAVAKFGPESTQARNALIRLSNEQRTAAETAKVAAGEMGTESRVMRSLGMDAKTTEREVGRFGRGALAGSGAVKGLGRSLAFASAGFLGAAGFVTGIKTSIGEATNLVEQIDKTKRVFQASGAAVLHWSKQGAAALGMARAAALTYASTFGNFLVPMGITRDRAAQMSTRLVELARDMASFNNKPVEAALNALQSGLARMPRPLRQFGVFLDVTRIKAEALRLGLLKSSVDQGKVADAQTKLDVAYVKLNEAQKKYGAGSTQVAQATVAVHDAHRALEKQLSGTTGELTSADKAQAAYSIILHDTAMQQGDFNRTSQKVANQQRILTANVRDLQEELGMALYPWVNKVVHSLNGWLTSTLSNKQSMEHLKSTVDSIVGTLATFVQGVKDIADAVGGWGNAFKLVIGGLIAAKIIGIVKSVESMRLAMVAAGRQAVISGKLQQGASADAAAAYGAGTAEMKAATIGLAATIKGALITTGIGALLVAVSFAVEYIITHWEKVKRWVVAFGDWIAAHWKLMLFSGPVGWTVLMVAEVIKHFNGLKLAALKAVEYIVEPFSHLPGRLGSWARRAKVAIDKELWDLEGKKAADAGAAAAQQFGTMLVAGMAPFLQQTQERINAMWGAASGQNAAAGGNPNAKAQSFGTQATLVTKARNLGVGSGSVYRTGGGHGGVAKPGTMLDCSGYVFQVYSQAGFKGFPGTSETQWSTMSGPNWTSEVIPANNAQPGDVVFRVGSPEYPSPGHVGIVTGGSGANAMVMSYYSTGKPAHVEPMSSISDLVGVKRFYLVKRSAGKGGTTDTGGTSGSTGTAGTHATHTGTATKTPLIPPALQLKLSEAEVTKGTADDLRALKAIQRYLEQRIKNEKDVNTKLKLLAQLKKTRAEIARDEKQGGMSKAELITLTGSINATLRDLPKQLDPVEQQAVNKIKEIRDKLQMHMDSADVAKLKNELAKWRKVLKDEIKKNADAAKEAAKQAADELKQEWENDFSEMTRKLDRSLSEAWQATQKSFDRETQQGLKAIQDAASEKIRLASHAFDLQMRDFDRATQAGLDALNAPAETPTEKLLRERAEQKAADEQQKRVDQLNKDIAAAQPGLDQLAKNLEAAKKTLAIAQSRATNPAQLTPFQQAVQDAQTALDQANADQQARRDEIAAGAYDQETARLEKIAQAEREAADKKAAADQQAYQDARDELKYQLEQQEALLEKHIQDAADAQAVAYQDERDAQWQHLQDMRDDQQIAFDNDLKQWEKWIEDKKASWQQFIDWLKQNGVNPTGVTEPNPTGPPQPPAQPTQPPGTTTTVGGIRWIVPSDGSPPVATTPVPTEPSSDAPGHGVLLFAGGGIVPGRYTGRTDTVRAMLTPGEGVISRDWMRRLLDTANRPPLLAEQRPNVTIQMQNTFAAPPADPHLFSRSLEFELRSIG